QRQISQDLQLFSWRQTERGRHRGEVQRRRAARRLLRRVRAYRLPRRRSRARDHALLPGCAGMREGREPLDRNSCRREIVERLSGARAGAEAAVKTVARRTRVRRLASALTLLMSLAYAPGAFAHASLLQAQPADGAVLPSAPTALTL